MNQMNTHRAALAFAIAAAALSAASPAAAQGFLLPATPEKGVWVEAAYSDFDELDVSLLSTVWYVTGRLPVTQRVRALVDVPLSHAKLDLFGTGEESSTVIGNPFLGVEFAASERLVLELGMRAPLTTADAESFADMTAVISDPMRAEAFLEDVVPVSAAATFDHPLSPRFALRGRAGGTVFFVTEEESEREASLDYGLLGTYTAGDSRLAFGFSGRWFATNDEGSFGENSLHRLALSGDVLARGVRPGITVRVPLDEEWRGVVNSTVGLYLQVPVR